MKSNAVTKTATAVKVFVVTIASEYVKEAVVIPDLMVGEKKARVFEDVSVVLGATYGSSIEEAIDKMSMEHEINPDLLTGFEVSN